MKSIKQLSDEEQREARIVQAHQEFHQAMMNIEANYLRQVQRNRRTHRLMNVAILIIAALAMLLPAAALAWRLLR